MKLSSTSLKICAKMRLKTQEKYLLKAIKGTRQTVGPPLSSHWLEFISTFSSSLCIKYSRNLIFQLMRGGGASCEDIQEGGGASCEDIQEGVNTPPPPKRG